MIDLIAEFLGISATALSGPVGVTLCVCLIVIFALAFIKLIIYWLQLFFGRW